MNEIIDVRIIRVLCTKPCKYFEDRGLREDYYYRKKKHNPRKIQYRFYCNFYREYLTTLYERCTAYEQM